ncbi:MAG: metal-dependent transcriptional regulator, partial [Phototrophicaceae bacterium]
PRRAPIIPRRRCHADFVLSLAYPTVRCTGDYVYVVVPESRSVQDFLKAVFTLEQETERVSTNALADALKVKAPSVTDMARRLESAGLLHYEKYRGMTLSAEGRRVALGVLRRHRLIELYLMSELGYELYEVHAEAEQLEHVVSEKFVEAIAQRLGNPNLDPHGDPIPNADGVMIQRDLQPLSELTEHTRARVAQLRTEQSDLLQHLQDRGLMLNAPVEVLSREPFHGPLTVLIGDTERTIGHQVAQAVWVEISL